MMRTKANRGADIVRTQTIASSLWAAHADCSKRDRFTPRSLGKDSQAMSPLSPANASPVTGSLDGDGSADHDEPYRFGCRPRSSATYPFNTRQYARLLALRGRVRDQIGASLELLPVDIRPPRLQPFA